MFFTVNNQGFQIRLDRYLRTLYPTMSQGVIEKNLRTKEIKVNDLKVKSNFRVTCGDIIYVSNKIHDNIPDVKPEALNPAAIGLGKKLLNQYLLFEHEEFFAINKPQGVAVQGGTNIKYSLDDCFDYLRTVGHDLRLVHRIDKDTSGLLLIARNRNAAIKLTEAFKQRIIKKSYLAVVNGDLKLKSGIIKTSIEDKPAETNYEVVNSLSKKHLVRFSPSSGRTHQIRLHALELGGYICGDSKYGNPQDLTENKLMLHSWSVTLPQSLFGKDITITAPIPDTYKRYGFILPEN
ncbi:MAG: RluA family pseudouridine synthase [Rickettsiaceae bacterium]|nr:RluA family pseudouridine synthase [Rickettsiaceae bacterium]